jgi:hypothetical protein
MTLVSYRDLSIYRLYNREADAVILSCSVDINESPPPTTEPVNNDDDPPIESDKDKSSDASTISDTIHVIPRDTTILDPCLRLVEVTINKKEEIINPPSRSGIPKIRYGKPK